MRISTSTIYDSGVATMQQQTQRLQQTQQQLSTGLRILTPADDPVAAAQALQVSQSQAINTQYGTNNGTASDSLTLEESTLGSITTLLQSVQTLAINAGDATLNQSDRAILANAVRGSYQNLLGLANTSDGSGQHLFSGYRGGIRPFSESAPGTVVYNGDQGQRLIQVGASQQVAVSDAGSEVFQRIPTGNGSFATQAAAGNSGSGVIDGSAVLDPAKWNATGNSKDYTVKFSVSGGSTTYDIVDNTTGKSMLTGIASTATGPYPDAYSSGSNINLSQVGPPAFDLGAQVSISGTPSDGDSFTIKTANQDVFATLSKLANLLQTASGAALTNGLAAAQLDLGNALQNISTVRASTGVRMNELAAAQNAGSNLDLQYSQTLSRLQSVDYAQAASDLSQEQLHLQAAQKSFAQVAGLSLFSYL